MEKISYEITQQVIKCFGTCFHYKNQMEAFLVSAKVPTKIIKNSINKPKYVWASDIMVELSLKEEHIIIQRKIITDLCNLKDIYDNGVEDKKSAMDVLRKLRIMVSENDKKAKLSSKVKNKDVEYFNKSNNKAIINKNTAKLSMIENKFKEQMVSSNRQEAGFQLELILQELFILNKIAYDCSFRTPQNTQQIDGYFNYDGFDYLVEAKWTAGKTDSANIAPFKHKIDTKLESTRGIFISMNGFREEVISEYGGKGSKIIFMDGLDLIVVLEGRISLKEALTFKIKEAVKFGNTYASLRTFIV